MRKANKAQRRNEIVNIWRLTPNEVAQLTIYASSGGLQDFQNKLCLLARDNGGVVTLNQIDTERLIRYFRQYGGGGPQGRIRRAFSRSLLEGGLVK